MSVPQRIKREGSRSQAQQGYCDNCSKDGTQSGFPNDRPKDGRPAKRFAEVCHRLMIIEAVERKLVRAGNVVRKQACGPDLIRQLSTYEAAIESIPAMRIEVSAISVEVVMNGLRL